MSKQIELISSYFNDSRTEKFKMNQYIEFLATNARANTGNAINIRNGDFALKHEHGDYLFLDVKSLVGNYPEISLENVQVCFGDISLTETNPQGITHSIGETYGIYKKKLNHIEMSDVFFNSFMREVDHSSLDELHNIVDFNNIEEVTDEEISEIIKPIKKSSLRGLTTFEPQETQMSIFMKYYRNEDTGFEKLEELLNRGHDIASKMNGKPTSHFVGLTDFLIRKRNDNKVFRNLKDLLKYYDEQFVDVRTKELSFCLCNIQTMTMPDIDSNYYSAEIYADTPIDEDEMSNEFISLVNSTLSKYIVSEDINITDGKPVVTVTQNTKNLEYELDYIKTAINKIANRLNESANDSQVENSSEMIRCSELLKKLI